MDTSVVRATLSSPAHASTMGAASPNNNPEIPAEYQFFMCNVLFTGEPERRQKKYPRSSVKRPMHHSHTAAMVLRGLARGTVDVAAHDHGYPIGWSMSSGRGSNDVLGRSDWLSPGFPRMTCRLVRPPSVTAAVQNLGPAPHRHNQSISGAPSRGSIARAKTPGSQCSVIPPALAEPMSSPPRPAGRIGGWWPLSRRVESDKSVQYRFVLNPLRSCTMTA